MHVAAGTGPAYWTAGCMFRFLVSSEEAGGSYTTMEITVPPGEGANPHFHPNEEEQFYVLCGELTYEVDKVLKNSPQNNSNLQKTMHKRKSVPMVVDVQNF